MQEDRFWLLASLKLSGEASSAELAELSGLLLQHPEMAIRFEIFSNVWRQQHPDNPVKKADAFNKHLQRLSTHLSAPVLQYESGRRRRMFFLLSSAAAACLVIGFCIYQFGGFGTNGKADAPAYNTVSTKPGSKSKIQLPDGTQVILNADSRLTYNTGSTGSSREVQLTGEAYFDVAKDKSHPFLIHTPSVDIRVLGTAFNVRSYGNEWNTETALFQGSVEITLRNSPDKKIILRPNEKLIVRNNELSVKDRTSQPVRSQSDEPLMVLSKVHFQKKDSSITESLWTKNQLAFDSASLDQVAREIERWYAVKVTIADERLKNIHLTAVFEDESLPQVMEALRITGNFKYSIHKKELTIAP